MDIPKTQQDLIKLLFEQDKRLKEQEKRVESLRSAIMVLDKRLAQQAKLMETSRHHTRKLQQRADTLQKTLVEAMSGGSYRG